MHKLVCPEKVPPIIVRTVQLLKRKPGELGGGKLNPTYKAVEPDKIEAIDNAWVDTVRKINELTTRSHNLDAKVIEKLNQVICGT